MNETTHSDDVKKSLQELNSYLSESTGILKSIRTMKEDAEKIVAALSQKKDELSRHEQDIVDYLEKIKLVWQKAEALLSPIQAEKEQLEVLDRKVAEALSGIDGAIQQKVDLLSGGLSGKQQALETELHESLAALRKELETSSADSVHAQHALVDKLSQRIDGAQQEMDTQKTVLDGLGNTVKKMGADDTELRRAAEGIKATLEKNRHDSDSALAGLRRATEDIKATLEKDRHDFDSALVDVRQKQREELTAALTELQEKQKKEFQSSLDEMVDKSIKPLEKEYARIKSVLNAAVEKLNNVKFKKLLGL